MPIQIQNSNAWLRLLRAFDIRGRHKLLLDEVVVPVIVLDDVSQAPGQQQQRRDATGGRALAPGVAVIAQIQLFNPVGSGVILELYQIAAGQGAGTTDFLMSPTTAALGGAPTSAQWQDRSQLAGSIPRGQIQTSILNAAPTGTFPTHVRSPGAAGVVTSWNVTLPPGNGWLVEIAPQNRDIEASFWWFEHDESE